MINLPPRYPVRDAGPVSAPESTLDLTAYAIGIVAAFGLACMGGSVVIVGSFIWRVL